MSFNDPGASFQPYYDLIETNLSAAIGNYSRLLVSPIASSIQIEISFSDSVTRATGFSDTSAFVRNQAGVNIFEQGVAAEIRTGVDPNGVAPDLHIEFQPIYLTDELWFDPAPLNRNLAVPANKTDAVSVLIHELTHAIGFNGWRDGTNAAIPGSPPYESTFDQWETFDGTTIYFTGPNAEAVYGGPVPITLGDNFHVGNAPPRPGSDLLPDLMNGVVYYRGTRYYISPLDLAMLSDAGVVVLTPLPGDYNGDGVVNAADYTVWRDTLGSTTDLRANGDNNGASAGKIDQADYDLWKTNFGMHAGNGTGEGLASMVAEPSTAALLVIGCVVALVARRR
jgi:hypothetical protein